MTTLPDVDADRLRDDIETTATFGVVPTDEGHARTVRAATPANGEARDYLVSRLRDAGLDVEVDRVGNVVGRWTPPGADPEAPPVAAGSHLDSVPEGGIFDGPLGVYAALESVRAMQDAGLAPTRPVEVVSFTEEEGGRFGNGLLGSSVATGVRPVEDALTLEDDDGVSLGSALDAVGYAGTGRLDASRWDAWLELHVEQDTRLESAGVPVGVVTTITGITQCEVTIRGEANHAGTTAMRDRTDALAAASEVILDVERVAAERAGADGTTVGTVGACRVRPGAPNVVPGAVELGLDVRDVERAGMEHVVEALESSLLVVEHDRGVETDLSRPLDVDPTPMADRVREAAHAAGERTGIETVDLHSGAGHDSMYVARVTDAGMLFAPSRGGVSHNPLEWTDWSDCAAATRVLATALWNLSASSNDE